MRIKKRILSLIIFTPVLLLYQNCGVQELGSKISASLSAGMLQPEISLSAPVLSLTNLKTFDISYKVSLDPKNSLTTMSCLLNQTVISCSPSRLSLSGLADGDYVVKLNATDNKGQKATELVVSFRVDATKPNVLVTQTPAAITGASSAQFIFSATDALSGVSKVECLLDNAAYSTCSSPWNLSSLATGNHTVKIRATDNATNIGDEYTYSWSVNTSAAVITISQMPAAFSNSKSATFSFSGTANGITITEFDCSLDNAAAIACTSSKTYSNLNEGSHTFSVRGKDSDGNWSSAFSYTWIVDTVAPVVSGVTANVNAQTKQTSASLSFSATDGGGSGVASYTCSLDFAVFATCISPQNLTGLAVGSHTFQVKAMDNAGNTSTVGSFTWNIDTVLPVVTITSGPTASTQNTSANFVFAVTDVSSGIQSIDCQIDSAAYTTCTTAASYSSLAVGAHTFRVRAIDKAGNQTIQPYNWTIIAPLPVSVTLAWDPNTESNLSGYMIHYGTSSGNYSQTVSAGLPAIVAGAVTFVVPNLPAGQTYYFVVTAYDSAQTETAFSNEVSKVVP